jgi:hypothetical protein
MILNCYQPNAFGKTATPMLLKAEFVVVLETTEYVERAARGKGPHERISGTEVSLPLLV